MGFAIIAGVFFLYLGSEMLVKGGSSLALRLKIAPLVIGLTVIAFSTGSPELFVSADAAFEGHGDLSLGNIIGSNIFTVAGILSFCALFHPIPLKNQLLKFDLPVMTFASCLLALFFFIGQISRWIGALFLFFLIAYTIAVYLVPKKRSFIQEKEIVDEIGKPLKNIWLDVLFIFIGLLFLIFGSHLFVKGAIFLAQLVGISEASIGLTIVAIGTSLPELSCSLVALWRKKFDLLTGNIIGSNIFNIFCVLGTSALIRPIQILSIHSLDLAMLILTAIILFPFFQKHPNLSRVKAIFILCIYLIYIAYIFIDKF